MNSKTNSDTPARTKPQLFGSQTARPDFENSILASIDGGTHQPAAISTRSRWFAILGIWGAAAAVGLGTWYVLADRQESTAVAQAVPTSNAPAIAARMPAALPTAAVQAASVQAQAASTMASAGGEGGAAIETVRAVGASAASPFAVLAAAPTVATPSMSLAASSAVSAPASAASTGAQKTAQASKKQASAKQSKAAARKAEAQQVSAKKRSASPSATPVDSDAELLAAMLPHVPRSAAVKAPPSSPAFERRCGHLQPHDVDACRLTYCASRQGQDAACPVVSAKR